MKVLINSDEMKILLAEYAIQKLGLEGHIEDYAGEVELVIEDDDITAHVTVNEHVPQSVN